MRRLGQFIGSCGAAMALLFCVAAEASARIDVNLVADWGGYYEAGRWNTATGSQLVDYLPMSTYAFNFETVDSIAMNGPDSLYMAGNGLGTIGVLKFDVATGLKTGDYPAYLSSGASMAFGSTGTLFTAGTDWPGTNSVIRALTPNPGGTVKERVIGPEYWARSLILSADGQSVHLLQNLTGSSSQVSTYLLSDLFPPDNSTPVTLPTPTSSFGLGAGFFDMTLGPDGLLYMSNSANNQVVRYTAAGAVVDTFANLPAYDLEFIDNRLLALADGDVIELNPQSGAFVQTLIPATVVSGMPYRFLQMEAFVVPEPDAVGLATLALAGGWLSRRRSIA